MKHMSNCCHNNDNTQFIRKNSQMDIDYNICEDENTIMVMKIQSFTMIVIDQLTWIHHIISV